MADFAHSIHDVGHRASAYKYCELLIASTLSQWIDVIEEPSARAMCGSHAHVHADHAEVWHERIPILWDKDASTWTTDGADELVTTVVQLDTATPSSTTEKLALMYRTVLPALLQSYNAHLATVDSRVDPATARMLQICITDTRDHIEQAHDVIARLSSAS
jgi:hypothetical protein